jgi:hypothetical protein
LPAPAQAAYVGGTGNEMGITEVDDCFGRKSFLHNPLEEWTAMRDKFVVALPSLPPNG